MDMTMLRTSCYFHSIHKQVLKGHQPRIWQWEILHVTYKLILKGHPPRVEQPCKYWSLGSASSVSPPCGWSHPGEYENNNQRELETKNIFVTHFISPRFLYSYPGVHGETTIWRQINSQKTGTQLLNNWHLTMENLERKSFKEAKYQCNSQWCLQGIRNIKLNHENEFFLLEW